MKKKIYVITTLAENESWLTEAFSMVKTNLEETKEYLKAELDSYIEVDFGLTEDNIALANAIINRETLPEKIKLNNPNSYLEFTIKEFTLELDSCES